MTKADVLKALELLDDNEPVTLVVIRTKNRNDSYRSIRVWGDDVIRFYHDPALEDA